MKTCVVKFNSLADLATYLKIIQPSGYTINTLHFTLSAKLSSFELAVAMEEYGAAALESVSA